MASHVVLHAHRLSVFLYCDVEQKGNCMTVYVIPYVLLCELFLSPRKVNSLNFTAALLLLQYLSVTQWLPHIVTVYLSHACLAPKDFLITVGLKVALLIKWLSENNFPFQSQDALPTMGRETLPSLWIHRINFFIQIIPLFLSLKNWLLYLIYILQCLLPVVTHLNNIKKSYFQLINNTHRTIW